MSKEESKGLTRAGSLKLVVLCIILCAFSMYVGTLIGKASVSEDYKKQSIAHEFATYSFNDEGDINWRWLEKDEVKADIVYNKQCDHVNPALNFNDGPTPENEENDSN